VLRYAYRIAAASPTPSGAPYVVSYGFFFAMDGKNYYLSPIYPILLAAGAVVIERAVSRPPLT
jgi:hypothetical protein